MVTLLTSLLLAIGTIAPAEPPPATRPTTQQLDQAEALWAEALEAIDATNLERAAELFERVAAILPDHPVVWQNLGQVRQNLGQHEQSLAAWREVSRIEPDDWRAVSKQVQCLEALDRPRERDEAIARLYALHDQGKVEEPYFCREQLEVEGRKVMTYERFDLEGERAARWSFYVLTTPARSRTGGPSAATRRPPPCRARSATSSLTSACSISTTTPPAAGMGRSLSTSTSRRTRRPARTSLTD